MRHYRHPLTLRRTATGSLILAATLALGACGGSNEDAPENSGGEGVHDELRELLPERIREAGTLKVATSIYPPVNFYETDGQTLTGFDTELIEEIASRMGVDVEWNVIAFASIVPGIESGQYDFATDLNDTAEREEVVDFVTEFQDGTSILVAEGNPERLTDMDSLCGMTVLITQGSTQVGLVAEQSDVCSERGEGTITVLEVPDSPDALLAMRSGRADAYLANTLAASYSIANDQQGFELLDGVYDRVYAGLAFPKESDELRDAMQAGMQALMDDGFYLEVMESYGVEANAIETSRINAATDGQ